MEERKYTHKCEPEWAEAQKEEYGYGPAVTYCYEKDGILIVANGEYGSRVNFCPFCGYKAMNQVEGKEKCGKQN